MDFIYDLFEDIAKESHSRIVMSFQKESLLLSRSSFHQFEQHFPYEGGFLRGTGVRSKGYIRHVHAKFYDNEVEVHIDYGNMAIHPLLGCIHFVWDVVPYILFCILRYKTWYVPVTHTHENKKKTRVSEQKSC